MEAVLAGVVAPDVQNHSLAALERAADGAGFSSTCVSFRGFSDIDSVARAVHEHRPRLFGLSIQSTEAALASATLIGVLRKRGYTGIVATGGHFATLNADDLLTEVPGLDVVVRFAGEAACLRCFAAVWIRISRRFPGWSSATRAAPFATEQRPPSTSCRERSSAVKKTNRSIWDFPPPTWSSAAAAKPTAATAVWLESPTWLRPSGDGTSGATLPRSPT